MWPSKQKDVHHLCKSCKKCQAYGKRVLKPELCQTILAFDIFEKWGIDAIIPFLVTSKRKCYILIAVEYLSHWVEASAIRQETAKDVAKFMYEYICCKFGVPLDFLSNQGPGFRGYLVEYLYENMKITCRYTTPYYPQCNGLNERFNGKLVQILTKVMEDHSKNWDLELAGALWAYQISMKTGYRFHSFLFGVWQRSLIAHRGRATSYEDVGKVLGAYQ